MPAEIEPWNVRYPPTAITSTMPSCGIADRVGSECGVDAGRAQPQAVQPVTQPDRRVDGAIFLTEALDHRTPVTVSST